MTAEAVKDTSSEIWKSSMFNMALARYNAADYPKAMESVEKLIAVHPNDKTYYELLQQTALKSGDNAKAAAAAKKADELAKAGAP
jgi:predicted Zn-dependent protease